MKSDFVRQILRIVPYTYFLPILRVGGDEMDMTEETFLELRKELQEQNKQLESNLKALKDELEKKKIRLDYFNKTQIMQDNQSTKNNPFDIQAFRNHFKVDELEKEVNNLNIRYNKRHQEYIQSLNFNNLLINDLKVLNN